MTAPARNDLARLLELLASGSDTSAAQLAALSGLEAGELQLVEDAWKGLSLPAREEVISRAAGLAEHDPGLNFDALARIALDDAQGAVRRRGAEALWETGDRRMAARLSALLRDPDESVRAAAAKSLANVVTLYELGQFNAEQGGLIVQALRKRAEDAGESTGVRARALEALGTRSEPWVGALITSAYDHDDPRMRLAAVHAMGSSANEAWLEYVYETLLSDDPELRFEAVNAAAGIASQESIETVAELLDDDDTDVALAAVRALGAIGGSQAVGVLRAFSTRAPEAFQHEITEAIEEGVLLSDLRDEDG